MLTHLAVRNFKLFDDVKLELADRVVLIGPNNSGKTTALQALALWDIGLKRWMEKRGIGNVPSKPPGVTISRRDLIAVPVPVANLFWRNRHVRSSQRKNGKNLTENVCIEIEVNGIHEGIHWSSGLEFYYANEESFYCRPLRTVENQPGTVPAAASSVRMAYLPPMSGLAANETRLDPGAVNVRLGEGRTAEVLRNLCYQIITSEDGKSKWEDITDRIKQLFGSRLDEPQYVPERGEVTMTYRTHENVQLDISASGRGQLQTLLLLAHLTVNPHSVLLLDEPDAHLEILRQRQIYQLLSETAESAGSQIIAASHSEVILNEAADRDVLIAFVGRPHRINDRGNQAIKSLKEIGFEHYLQAKEKGWVLYLEGSTDLAVLLALARRLNHPAAELLQSPYVHYVANQPSKAKKHFYGLREAKPDLVGIALYDRLEHAPPNDPNFTQLMWRRREIENYLCRQQVLLDFAESEGSDHHGQLFGGDWLSTMEQSINEIEQAMKTLGGLSPWGSDIKASDDFLDRLFSLFYEKLKLPNRMRKADYYRLVEFVKEEDIDSEIIEKLDAIVTAASVPAPKRTDERK